MPLEWGRILTEDDFERIRCMHWLAAISVRSLTRMLPPRKPAKGLGLHLRSFVQILLLAAKSSGFHVGNERWKAADWVSTLPTHDKKTHERSAALCRELRHKKLVEDMMAKQGLKSRKVLNEKRLDRLREAAEEEAEVHTLLRTLLFSSHGHRNRGSWSP